MNTTADEDTDLWREHHVNQAVCVLQSHLWTYVIWCEWYRESSLEEQELYEQLCIKVEMSLIMLGRVYGALILGIGLCDLHHMACGRLISLFW